MDRAHRRPRHRALAVALATLLVPLVVGSASAAKAPKIAVCHLDQVTGTYSLNMISESGVAKHLAHGDGLPGEGDLDANCQPVPPPARVIATAWTDLNGNHVYDEGIDRLIAKLVDTDGSNDVSVDDTITTDQFPLDFAATIFADATVTSFVVTDVNPGDATTISVNAGEARFRWLSNPDFDRYDEQLDSLVNGFVDRSGPESCASVGDVLGVLAGSPSQPFPTNPSPISQCDELDNAFLDVTFS